MSEFDIIVGGESIGWFDEAEVVTRLETYRRENPDDPVFGRVQVIQLPEPDGGTAGAPRSVFDFIPEIPNDG